MNKRLYNADLWNEIISEVSKINQNDKILDNFFRESILNFNNIEECLSSILSKKLSSEFITFNDIINDVKEAVSNKKIKKSIEEDINATFLKDPACKMYCQPILFYKGFIALQAYRVGNFWRRDKLGFSLYIQSIVSELYGVDIHPNSNIGCGIMVDHATGIVIGETAELGDNSSIFHGVTLGGVGSDNEKRHPKVGKNVLLSANSTILGDIKVGDNVKIGAGSVVLKDLPNNCTAVGIPAKVIK